MSDLTHILASLERGDESAPERLAEAVYGELRRLAAAKLSRERPDHTLQPTALVNEAWLRLSGNATWENRRHFFGAGFRCCYPSRYQSSSAFMALARPERAAVINSSAFLLTFLDTFFSKGTRRPDQATPFASS